MDNLQRLEPHTHYHFLKFQTVRLAINQLHKSELHPGLWHLQNDVLR